MLQGHKICQSKAAKPAGWSDCMQWMIINNLLEGDGMVRFLKGILQLAVIFAAVWLIIMIFMWLSGYNVEIINYFMNNEEKNGALPVTTEEKRYVIPGGQSIGVKLDVEGVVVTGLEEITSDDGKSVNPGIEAGLQIGDVVIAIDGTEVHNAAEVQQLIENTEKESVLLKIGRRSEVMYLEMHPVMSAEEKVRRLGLWVREKTAGIGTLTYYCPESGRFAALGHGITDAKTGKIVRIAEGQLLDARILSLKEGKKGSPGELKGIFYEADEPIGRLEKNSSCGISGTAYKRLENNIYSEAVEIADAEDITEGGAVILTTISGDKVEKFEIEIEKINIDNRKNDHKDLVISVTDERLLKECGGIIQGMSGSPIIQDGKLIGAVTHVFVNDPTRGYGIFIESML